MIPKEAVVNQTSDAKRGQTMTNDDKTHREKDVVPPQRGLHNLHVPRMTMINTINMIAIATMQSESNIERTDKMNSWCLPFVALLTVVQEQFA
jgi:hypothetical protein